LRAIIHTKFGSPRDVLKLAEVDKPAASNGEVLVKVRAALHCSPVQSSPARRTVIRSA
jgi:NADPH:quinone reductase-like Zn-dependent oxidoreductase